MCLHFNLVKFLGRPFLHNTSERLLLSTEEPKFCKILKGLVFALYLKQFKFNLKRRRFTNTKRISSTVMLSMAWKKKEI